MALFFGRTLGLALCSLLVFAPGAGAAADADRAFESVVRNVRAQVREAGAARRGAEAVAALIAPTPGDVSAVFDPSFLADVPSADVRSLLDGFYESYGKVVSVAPLGQETAFSGAFLFSFASGMRLRVDIQTGSAAPYLVTGCLFKPVAPEVHSPAELIAELKKLPGTATFALSRLDESGTHSLISRDADRPMAIGSAFKLYILSTLVREHRDWSEKITIEDRFKSLPSGVMQDLPAGTRVTLKEAASKMISISDNTAADHLLHAAGREQVEAQLAEAGNRAPSLSIPFLSTLEVFKLKSAPGLRSSFLKDGPEQRRLLLAGPVARLPRSAVQPWASPLAIDSVEWFASAADLCRVMDHLRRQGDATALEILALNHGLEMPATIAYAGFKGGSEPGVLTMTWLLRTKQGDWYAMSGAWNDPDEPVDQMRFMGLMQAALDLVPNGNNN